MPVKQLCIASRPFQRGPFGPYGKDHENFLALNRLGFNTRYSGISGKPINKQRDTLLKSIAEVDENLNLKHEQSAELSSIKNIR